MGKVKNLRTSSFPVAVAMGSSSNTFDRLWTVLRQCYDRNCRSIERAYGGYDYLHIVHKMYTKDLANVTVKRVLITNQTINRPEQRNLLIESATEKHIFYAVFTLAIKPNCSLKRLDINWLADSKLLVDPKNLLTVQLLSSVHDSNFGRNISSYQKPMPESYELYEETELVERKNKNDEVDMFDENVHIVHDDLSEIQNNNEGTN